MIKSFQQNRVGILAMAAISVMQVRHKTAIMFALFLTVCIGFALGVSNARGFLPEAGAVNIGYKFGITVTPLLCAASAVLSATQSMKPRHLVKPFAGREASGIDDEDRIP